MNYKIIYRCFSGELYPHQFKHIRPKWFNKNASFKSLVNSINDSKIVTIDDLLVLHDGDKNEYSEYIEAITNNIQYINVKSNEQSLLINYNIGDVLFNHNNVDIIYFIEDDYLHTKNAVHTILRGTENFQLTTGFDHMDRYIRTDDLSKNKESIAFSKKTNCHWRTVESTTCTWACTKDMWNQIKPDVLYYKLEDRSLFRSLINKSIRLWSPIPGVSTTVDINAMSPGIDWEQINKESLN